LPRDVQKAHELYIQAGELGCAGAYCNLGQAYYEGSGEEVDMKKAIYYWELAAMGGSAQARHNLGAVESEAGNNERAMKHLMISAKAGYKESLNGVMDGFMGGLVTKDEYASTLRAYQKRQNEMKSDERDLAIIYYII
jgi:uncharacterized protein